MNVLDSDVIASFLKGFPDAVNSVKGMRSELLATTVISAQEILFGCGAPEFQDNKEPALDFLNSVDVLAYEKHDVEHVVDTQLALRRAGKRLGVFDEIIAGICLSRKATLVTRDKAFARVPGLKLHRW